VDFWFSLGLHVDGGGKITDVLKGGVGDKAGLGPGMQIIAVDGRAFTPTVMRTAIKDAQDAGHGPELIVQNTGFFRIVKLDYTGGERYPTLERVEGTPDILDQIIAPMAAQ
jgi:predicted metalloprotease with PDZ domain